MDEGSSQRLYQTLLDADLTSLEERCKDEKYNSLCDEKFWAEKLRKDYRCVNLKSSKIGYYKQNKKESLKEYENMVKRNTSSDPVVQNLLNRRKELLSELAEIEKVVSEEVNKLVFRDSASGVKLRSFIGKESKRRFDIILTEEHSDKIMFIDDDTPEGYFFELLKEYIYWEDYQIEDLYIFWQWYADGKLRPSWRAFIAYCDNGKTIYNRLYSDNPPQFLIDKFGEDKEAMNKFLSPYGLNLSLLTGN